MVLNIVLFRFRVRGGRYCAREMRMASMFCLVKEIVEKNGLTLKNRAKVILRLKAYRIKKEEEEDERKKAMKRGIRRNM